MPPKIQARIVDSSRYADSASIAGVEYVKGKWRYVPEQDTELVSTCTWMETRPVQAKPVNIPTNLVTPPSQFDLLTEIQEEEGQGRRRRYQRRKGTDG